MSESTDTNPVKNEGSDPARERRVSLPTVPSSSEASAAGAPSPEPLEAFGGSGLPPSAPIDVAAARDNIVAVLKEIYDPEIPLNIYDLGLIYDIDVSEHGEADVKMTLTAPGCPVADYLVREVADKVGSVTGIRQSHVELVWDPPWTKDRMSEEALLELGLL